MHCIQYSKDYLQDKDTDNLSRLYIERFIVSQECPEQKSQLELILDVLSQRPADELKTVHKEIERQLIAAAERKDNLMIYLLQEMRLYFQRRIS